MQDGGARELTAKLYDRLGAVGVPRKDVALVAGLLKLAGAERRTGDLYGTKTFSARASKMVRILALFPDHPSSFSQTPRLQGAERRERCEQHCSEESGPQLQLELSDVSALSSCTALTRAQFGG